MLDIPCFQEYEIFVTEKDMNNKSNEYVSTVDDTEYQVDRGDPGSQYVIEITGLAGGKRSKTVETRVELGKNWDSLKYCSKILKNNMTIKVAYFAIMAVVAVYREQFLDVLFDQVESNFFLSLSLTHINIHKIYSLT